MSDISRRTFARHGLGTTLAEPTLAAADYRIIDPHVHVWKHDPRVSVRRRAPNVPERDATPETLLELMKANGVSKTVIIQVIHYRYDNRFLAHVLKRIRRRSRASAAWIRWTRRRPTTCRSSRSRDSAACGSVPAGDARATGSTGR